MRGAQVQGGGTYGDLEVCVCLLCRSGSLALTIMRSACWKEPRCPAQHGSEWRGKSHCVCPSFSRTNTCSRNPVLLTWLLFYAAVVVPKLCFLLTSPSAHGESCSQGQMRQEVFFNEVWLVLVENNDQVRQTSLVTRSAFSAQTGVFTGIFCLC